MPRTFTSREFNQDASRVKRAATEGTVFITDRGRPAHVLMTIAEYERLHGKATGSPLVEFLESLPLSGIDLSRNLDTGRDAPL